MAKTVKLPWRPIADLPSEPAWQFEFLVAGRADHRSHLVRWNSALQWWASSDGSALSDVDVREGFSHFIEVTEP